MRSRSPLHCTLRNGIGLLLAGLLAACGDAPAADPASDNPPPLSFAGAPEGGAPAPALRAHGQRLGRVLGCTGCHGADLVGQAWSEDADVALLFTSNLTRELPLYDDAGLERALRLGVRPDGTALWEMPSELFTHLSQPDMAALVAWLRTIPPRGERHPRILFGPTGRRLVSEGVVKPAPARVREARGREPARIDRRHDWARYMIRATCSECHGLLLEGAPEGWEGRPPPDLAIVGAYSRDQFRRLLRAGEAPSGRDLGLMAQVARGRYANLNDAEVDAIFDYLQARAQTGGGDVAAAAR